MSAAWSLLSLLLVVLMRRCDAAPTEPQKCCFDKEFTAILGEMGGRVVNGQEVPLEATVAMGYDFYRQRQGTVSFEQHSDGTASVTYYLQDYANRLIYLVEGDGSCRSFDMAPGVEMFPPCISENATFLGSAELGYGSETLRIDSWDLAVPGPWNIKMSVNTDCVPVAQSLYGPIFPGGGNAEITLFFTDYHPGISSQDLNALNTPASCQHVSATVPATPVPTRPFGRRAN